jgi:hypothetical protein
MSSEAGAIQKELEDENRRLKKMYAESQMTADVLREAMAKKWVLHPTPGNAARIFRKK